MGWGGGTIRVSWFINLSLLCEKVKLILGKNKSMTKYSLYGEFQSLRESYGKSQSFV